MSIKMDARTFNESCGSFVYLIRCDSPSPLYKIGYAADPDQRLKDLQTGCPYELTLIMSYPGGSKEERWLHSGVKSHHVRGEWYDLDERDFRYIEACRVRGSAWYVVRMYPPPITV